MSIVDPGHHCGVCSNACPHGHRGGHQFCVMCLRSHGDHLTVELATMRNGAGDRTRPEKDHGFCPACIQLEIDEQDRRAEAIGELSKVSCVLVLEMGEPAAPLPPSDVDGSGLSLALMGQGTEAESMSPRAFHSWVARTFIRTDPT